MSGYEPPPPPEARGLRLGDLRRWRHLSDPEDEEPAFPAPRDEPARGSARASRSPRHEDEEPSWRRDLRERRKRERDTAAAPESRRTTERKSGTGARPGRGGAGERPDAARYSESTRAHPPERGTDPGGSSPRPTVRHVMKPRDPGRNNAPAAPPTSAPPTRKPPWRRSAKAAGTGAVGTAGALGADDAAPVAASGPTSGLARFVRRGSAAGDQAGGSADSGTQGGTSDKPGVPPPFTGGPGGVVGPSRPFSGTDLVMLVPTGLAAYYGAGLLVDCSHEAGFMAAFCLWLMAGFWIVIISAKWPLVRLMRWAWVLAGLMAGATIPIGGG
ncbi:hypothetical protein ACFRCG_11045 [Embleya sp. NPDC056575]|uniref:hypothetical protein n=1 Tax=unclassified Embleya TaxID=2699296 RepID=UPI0036CD329C